MKEAYSAVERVIDSYENEMIETMKRMIRIKAISPLNGGSGETERANFLESLLKSWGFKTKRLVFKDDTQTERPSIVAKSGNNGKTIWFVAHMDTVTEGDRTLWKTDPFAVVVDGDKMYGRGTNDNGQSLLSSVYAMRALKESGAQTQYDFGLILAADEEEGSKYGMQKLMNENLFNKGDVFVVPDWGTESGTFVELGEKGVLWLKITVMGKQVHASTPAEGVNAFRYMIRFLDSVDKYLHEKYSATNAMFNPVYSTFEMTKHEKGVESVNIVPGSDIAYVDCRVLPQYDLNDVLNDVKTIAGKDEFKSAKISIDVVNRTDAAPETNNSSGIALLLSQALKDTRGIDVKFTGIGGGTCAAFPRKAGYDAVVWSTISEIAHQPNEFARISDMVKDSKTLAYLCL